jgi:hypothetical protein
VFVRDKPCYTGAMAHAREKMLADLLGFGASSIPFTYIGCPIFKGKPNFAYFLVITGKIKMKLEIWKGTILSIMDRVQLVKSIIHGMLVYSFHVYMWPSHLLKQLDTWIKNYIEWGCSYSEALYGVLEGYVSSLGGGWS